MHDQLWWLDKPMRCLNNMNDEDTKEKIKVSAKFTITFDFEEKVVEAEIEKTFGSKTEAMNQTVKV